MSYILKIFVSLLALQQFFVIARCKNLQDTLQHDERFSKFYELIRYDRIALATLNHHDLTAFIPTNEAFEAYDPDLYSSLAFYHITYGFNGRSELKQLRNLTALDHKFPPLWVNRLDSDIFINNAKIIQSDSEKFFGHRNQQILHVIDEVLDPMLRDLTQSSYTALDLMTNPASWRLPGFPTLHTFLYKTRNTEQKDLFAMKGGHTFFIPLDSGVDYRTFNLVNKYVVAMHVVPNFVLFTRSTMKEFAHESMANDELIFTVVSLEERDGKHFVRANTVIGDSVNKKGKYVAEILVANIPVENGVVHLISTPLGLSAPRLKPFPYLPVIDKIATDPTLTTFYDMGEDTGFNKIFTTHNVSFTYFVPSDSVFNKLRKSDMSLIGREVDILKRHLVTSELPYTMDRLLSLSVNNGNAGVQLEFVGGPTKIQVMKVGDDYVIRWRKKYIKVVRADYECSDGVVHILDGVMANVQTRVGNVDPNQDHLKNYGEALSNMFEYVV